MLVVLAVVGQGLQILPWDPHYCALCVGWSAASLLSLFLGLSITGCGFPASTPLSLSLGQGLSLPTGCCQSLLL